MTQATCERESGILTTAQVAQMAGARLWWLRSLLHRRKLAPPAKLGPTFVWTAADLPRVKQALIAEGYLSNGGEQ
jgi:hypothetical protein